MLPADWYRAGPATLLHQHDPYVRIECRVHHGAAYYIAYEQSYGNLHRVAAGRKLASVIKEAERRVAQHQRWTSRSDPPSHVIEAFDQAIKDLN